MLAGIVLAESEYSVVYFCRPLPHYYLVAILLLRTYALWGLSRYVLWYIVVFDIVSDNQGVVVGLPTLIPRRAALILAVIKLRSSFQVNNFQCESVLAINFALNLRRSISRPSHPSPPLGVCFPFLGDKPDDVYIDFVCVMVAELSTASRNEQYPDIDNLSRCSAVDAVARSYALCVLCLTNYSEPTSNKQGSIVAVDSFVYFTATVSFNLKSYSQIYLKLSVGVIYLVSLVGMLSGVTP